MPTITVRSTTVDYDTVIEERFQYGPWILHTMKIGHDDNVVWVTNVDGKDMYYERLLSSYLLAMLQDSWNASEKTFVGVIDHLVMELKGDLYETFSPMR
jgi:hypothetical protein